jgi:hypothetical protein
LSLAPAGAQAEGLEFGPDELYVVGHYLHQNKTMYLLRQLFQDERTPLVVCPDDWLPMTRMLILDSDSSPRHGFLARAGRLAHDLAVPPVLLTVARTEIAARERQRAAREIFANQDLNGDFDFVVGSDVLDAVAGVARWRRSRLVVMERRGAHPWWRWSRNPTMERLMSVLTSVAFLALPEANVADFLPMPAT